MLIEAEDVGRPEECHVLVFLGAERRPVAVGPGHADETVRPLVELRSLVHQVETDVRGLVDRVCTEQIQAQQAEGDVRQAAGNGEEAAFVALQAGSQS